HQLDGGKPLRGFTNRTLWGRIAIVRIRLYDFAKLHHRGTRGQKFTFGKSGSARPQRQGITGSLCYRYCPGILERMGSRRDLCFGRDHVANSGFTHRESSGEVTGTALSLDTVILRLVSSRYIYYISKLP